MFIQPARNWCCSSASFVDERSALIAGQIDVPASPTPTAILMRARPACEDVKSRGRTGPVARGRTRACRRDGRGTAPGAAAPVLDHEARRLRPVRPIAGIPPPRRGPQRSTSPVLEIVGAIYEANVLALPGEVRHVRRGRIGGSEPGVGFTGEAACPAHDGVLANRQAIPTNNSATSPKGPRRRAPSIDYLRVDGPKRWPWRSSPDLGCNPSLSSGEAMATPTSGATCRRIVDGYLGGWNRLPTYPRATRKRPSTLADRRTSDGRSAESGDAPRVGVRERGLRYMPLVSSA